jgi:type IV pilus assembly protein PilY1
LEQIFTEIQAVNSVFASASLPVSVNTQGTYLNQVFIGMFRPDAKAAPRWKGNLKQYKFLASVQGSGYGLDLVDADEEPAINRTPVSSLSARAASGRPRRLTAIGTIPNSDAEGSCTAINGSKWSNSPDGEVVEKGAAGYMLRAISPAARVVKTCSGCASGAMSDFNDGNSSVTATALGAADAAERTKMINWVRGADVLDEDDDGVFNEMRPSALGDVVHSRPVAVDYGGTTGVVVFYGANDGMLHAVDGNQPEIVGGVQQWPNAGKELWSFVAPEHYGRLKRIYDNSTPITFPSTGDATAKPYFFDGPVTAHKEGSTVHIFATQRRGGRMIYAFDVSSPASPSLLWRQGCTTPLGDDSDCTTGFSGIGQTWSAPKIFKAEGYSSSSTKLPMVIVGGGYDTCEDDEPHTCSTPKGNKVYVLDATTGLLLKHFTTDRSVVGDVTVVPNQGTGLADYAYLADSGGNVYRITMGADPYGAWTMTKIAALGCASATCTVAEKANRKFLFAPEVVVMTQYPSQNAVLIGSGDREHPLLSNSVTAGVQNAFFMILDRPKESTWLSSESTNCGGSSVICLNSLAGFSNTGASPSQTTLDTKKGWYMTLSSTEQVVTSAVVLFGEITFSSHMPAVPDANTCNTNLGTARVYNIGYLNGAAVGQATNRFEKISGGGLPPSPVSGLVTVKNPTDGSPMTVPFIIGASKESPVEVTLKSGSSGVAGNKERVYWYIEQ